MDKKLLDKYTETLADLIKQLEDYGVNLDTKYPSIIKDLRTRRIPVEYFYLTRY